MKKRAALGVVPNHDRRAEIEREIARGVPYRKIAKRYEIGFNAVARHKIRMVRESPDLFRALAADDWKVPPEELEALRVESSAGWLKAARQQFTKWLHAQDKALAAGNVAVGAQAGAQANRVLAMIGQAVNELGRHTVAVEHSFILTGPYLEMRAMLLRVLAAHPEARRAVIEGLQTLEGKLVDAAPKVAPALPAPVSAEAAP